MSTTNTRPTNQKLNIRCDIRLFVNCFQLYIVLNIFLFYISIPNLFSINRVCPLYSKVTKLIILLEYIVKEHILTNLLVDLK